MPFGFQSLRADNAVFLENEAQWLVSLRYGGVGTVNLNGKVAKRLVAHERPSENIPLGATNFASPTSWAPSTPTSICLALRLNHGILPF